MPPARLGLTPRPPPPTPTPPLPPGIKPEQVDILISNCSIFCPTPSLASMLINKFKFRQDIQAYHLGGMGCSIGVVAVGLVRDMLAVSPGARFLS
jgi:3-ketoacyl-CoA synthase